MTISSAPTSTDPHRQSGNSDETITDHSPAAPARQSAVQSLRGLLPFARPALPALIGSALTAMVAMLCGLAFPLVIQQIIDGPIAAHDLPALWPYAGLLLLLGFFEAALFWVRRMLASRPTMRVEAAMRAAIYDHLQKLPVSFHDRWSAGQLMSRAVSDLVTIRRFLAFGLVFLFVNITTFVVGVVILLVLSWQLGLVIAALAIPLVALSFAYESKYQLLARRSQDQVGDLATMVEESVLGIRILKAFGRSGHLTRRFLAEAAELKATELGKARVISKLWAVIIAVPEIAFGLTLFLGIRQVAGGELSAGALVAFFGVALGLRWPIDSIGWLLAMSNDAATATQRFYEVMDAPITVSSPSHPVATPAGTGQADILRCAVRVRRRHRRCGELLRGVDLDIAPGETVALVGATGSGKTTLTSLVNRLYDVTGGSITLDGVDIRRLDLGHLRRQIAVAFEEPTLFSASVRENVLLGRPAGSDEDVLQALRIAQADFVLDLPWGLDTRIGEQGLSLSGGQRQRLALARAVVGRPPVLVLDDPLSALDIHTESQVEKALRSVLAGTTALVVAHRASTVLLADRVALLVDGRIVATGTHSELMTTEPRYQDLLASRDDVSTAAAGLTARRDRGHASRSERSHRGGDHMTNAQTTTPIILDPEADDAWRGVAAEDTDDISHSVGIKLQARSRRLLGSLIRPHRWWALLAAAIVLISELAYLVGPLAVAYGIDTAVPELAAGNAGPLVYATLVYLAAGMTNAAGKAIFVRLSAKVAQAVLLDLRGRVFTHSQALSLSFHERYTSGRVISRMTSDLDALADLAAESLEGLISGLLSVVAISITLLVLDVQLGLIALAAFIPILLATRWFQHRSRRIYRRTRSAIASVIVQFTETMNGLRAVLSFRREEKNRAIFGAFNDENAQANGDGLDRPGGVHPTGPAVRKSQPGRHHDHRRCAGHRRRHGDRGAGGLPAVRAADVRPAGRAGDVLQHLPGCGGGTGEAVRSARGGPGRPRAGQPGAAGRRRCCRRRG